MHNGLLMFQPDRGMCSTQMFAHPIGRGNPLSTETTSLYQARTDTRYLNDVFQSASLSHFMPLNHWHITVLQCSLLRAMPNVLQGYSGMIRQCGLGMGKRSIIRWVRRVGQWCSNWSGHV